jgi:hypothetical protein
MTNRELIEHELVCVSEQWEKERGWKVRFDVERSKIVSPLMDLYHLTLRRKLSWFRKICSICDPLDVSYLGTIVFWPDREGGWLSPVNFGQICNIKFSGAENLSLAVEAFFTSLEVRLILDATFGKSKVKKGTTT